MENKPSISIGTILLGLLITSAILLTYYFFPTIKNNYQKVVSSRGESLENSPESPIPTPTRNPNYKLPAGPQSYNFSHGDQVVGPRVTSVSFSPLAAEKDTKQSLSAVFPSSEKVTSAIFSFSTDTLSDQKVDLKQKPDNPSIWEATWTMPDTTKNKYHVRLIFSGEKGVYDEVMRILE